MRERIVAGNWKLHGDRVFARALLDEVIAARPAGVRLAIFPPLPYLGELVDRYGAQGLEFGAQDVVRHPLVARIIDAYEQRAQEE